MVRYSQTLSRIGSGLATISALVWFLWPAGDWKLEAEPLLTFVISLGVWFYTEFKLSEEVIYRASTPNDIRYGREILAYSKWEFRELLRDHNYHRGIDPRFLAEASMYVDETELGIVHFQDKAVQKCFQSFCERLREFVDYFALHSSPERFGAVTLQSVIPANQYVEMIVAERHQLEINEVNRLARETWEAMQPLITAIEQRIPEVFDEPVKGGWIRSSALGQNS